MVRLTRPAILAAREARYRRRMDIRVTTQEQAVEFVNDVGFCFLFPIKDVVMPSLWDAIAGRVVPTSSSHSGYEIDRTWGWKDDSLNKKQWYYGKLIRSRATLASLDFLPNFYALSERLQRVRVKRVWSCSSPKINEGYTTLSPSSTVSTMCTSRSSMMRRRASKETSASSSP